jgi:hypothetical protein
MTPAVNALAFKATPYGMVPSLDGTNGYYNLVAPGAKLLASSTTPLTISWAEYWGTASSYMGIFAFQTGSGGNSLFGFRAVYPAAAGYAPFTVSRSGTGVTWDVPVAIATTNAVGDFHRFVLVGAGGASSATPADWTLYIDGVSYAARATTIGTGTTTVSVFGWDGLDSKFPGSVFDFLIAERSWGPEEVANYFAYPYAHYALQNNKVYFDQAAAAAGFHSRYFYDMTSGAANV